MLPPVLEVYVVWHPLDSGGRDVAQRLIDHFHGTAFSGLIGGAVEVFVRSEAWDLSGGAPRRLPHMSDGLPANVEPADTTVIVPVLGTQMAVAVADGGPWRDYVLEIGALAENPDNSVLVLPVRLTDVPRVGELAGVLGKYQSTDAVPQMCRDVAQSVLQFLEPDAGRLQVFVSHTKHGVGADAPGTVVQRVRHEVLGTRLEDFVDTQDLQLGEDWSEKLRAAAATGALLAIRTDQYASRAWCQTEVFTAKGAGMPVVMLEALTEGEDRGSFLMDHVPRIPTREHSAVKPIRQALQQIVDEALKRAIWRRQRVLAAKADLPAPAWWAPHAPEPVTLARWLNETTEAELAADPLIVLHPDPPLGPDEVTSLQDVAALSGLRDTIQFLTPRELARHA